MENNFEELRFNKIYAFITLFGLITVGLIAALVFCRIPKDNQQSANMALAFCMSAFTGLMGYLIGASPDKKKTDAPGGNTTTVATTTTLTEPTLLPNANAANNII